MANKQIYLVGGGVRDALMGRPTSDLDWLVVGQTPEQMVADGFLPVGRDFPIFLHPTTKDEYALARTERKSGPGYRGFETNFSPDVTLEQDLVRRDLTINALAVPLEAVRRGPQGGVVFAADAVIDCYGGIADLKAKRLRHVGPAFVEDPVRILRVARFAARFHDFEVATATQALMQAMVVAGEVDALVPERVWQELATGLMEAHPSRMFQVLKDCGALQRLLPEVQALWGVPQRAEYHPEIDCGVHVMMVLDQAARLGATLPVRYACLTHDLGKATTSPDVLPRHLGHEGRSVKLLRTLSERIRVPVECRELALIVAAEHGNIHRSQDLNAASLVRLFERLDAFRRPDRLPAILQACEADARGRLGFEDEPYAAAPRLLAAFEALRLVDTAQIAAAAAAHGKKGPAIGQAIAAAREAALKDTTTRQAG
jgi:tRNA nucleotidyltransferase (CCA-adding enzyme)